MQQYELTAVPRAESGTRASERVRREGRVPVVVYGHEQPPVTLTVDAKDFTEIQKAGAQLVRLAWNGNTDLVVLKEVQRHPVTHTPLNIDFQRVGLRETIELTVPLVVVGEPTGCTLGGILERPMHEITIECLVSAIPESIEVDVSGLRLDDVLHVADITAAEGITILSPAEEVVASVSLPRIAEEPTEEGEAAEEGAAEPEAGE